jgi:hypothetical protein
MPNIFDDLIPSKSAPSVNIFDDIIPPKPKDNIPEIRNVPSGGLGPIIPPKIKPIGYTIQGDKEGVDPFTQLGEFVKRQPLTIPVGIAAPAFVATQEALSKLPRASSFFKKQIEQLPETTDVENLGHLGQEFSYLGKVTPRQDTANLLDSAQAVAEFLASGKVENLASQKLLENAVKTLGGKLTAAGYGEAKVTIPQENLTRLGKYTPSGEALLTNLKARTIKIPAQAPATAGGAAVEVGKAIEPFAAEIPLKGAESIKPPIIPTKNIFDDIIPTQAPKSLVPGDLALAKPPIPAKTAVTPTEAPIVNVGPVLALKLKNGQVISDNTAKLHADILTTKKVNPEEVADVGTLDPKGDYIATKKPDWKGGEIIQENLKPVPEDLLKKVQGIVKPTELTDESVIASMTPKEKARYDSLKNISERAVGNKFALASMDKLKQEVRGRLSKPAEVKIKGAVKPVKVKQPEIIVTEQSETLEQVRASKGYVGDEQYKANLETNLKQYENKKDKTPEDLKYIEETKQRLQELKQPIAPVATGKSIIPDLGKAKKNDEFKVGDVLDPQRKTNMVGKVTIREISGNTLKFTDSEGTEFSGMQRSLVRTLINEGSWKKVTNSLAEIKPDITALYDQYYKEFIAKKYSVPEARRRAKQKMAEGIKKEPTAPSGEKQQVIQEEGEMFKKAQGGKGLGSPAEGESIDEAQVTEKDEVNKGEFKLYKEIQTLINNYARLFGEKYAGNPRKRSGVFYPDTKNIFLQTINNISTAAHEVMHFLDDKFGITQVVTTKTGEAKNGNPIYDSSTKVERKQLTEVYLKYYPTARADHKLKKRVEEGMAVLISRYIMNKEETTVEFPDLVNMFFKEGGKYYDSVVNDMVKEAQGIIRRYNQLDPLQKIGAIVMSDDRPVEKGTWLNIKEKILQEVFDNVYPIEKLGKEAGKKGTTGDPSLWVRLYNNANAIVINNLISENRGYWTIKDGAPAKLYDFNWKNLVKKLTDLSSFEQFGNWLVARDTKFNYDRLDKLKEEAKQATEFLKEVKDDFEAGMIGGNIRNDIKEAKDKIRHYQELAQVLSKNKISREVSNKAYDQHKERFAEVSDMFDKLVRADLDLLYDTGMIKTKVYEELISKEGYAPLKRDVYNELLGTPTTEYSTAKKGVGRNKVSSMISRHGSNLTIINPLYSSMLNHAEVVKKSLRQIIYNKIYDLSSKFPDLFQEIELVRSIDKNGRISYPQEKDPNILMAYSGGKRIPMVVSQEIKTVLDELLTYKNIHLFEKILIGANKLFTKGTTGLYLPFTASNFIVDQTTATAQTNENIKPVFDPLKTMMIALEAKFAGYESADTKYLEEYLVLGGSRQTLVGWQDMSADDMYRLLSFEKHYLNRAIDTLNNVEDVVAFLPKWSEILTRASEYIKARKAGKEIIVAMEEAGRVTAPFHHRGRHGGGTVGRTAIQSLPFFNASLQVLAQYGRTLHDPKTRKRALMVVLALMTASISSLAYLIAKGTKEQKDAYKSISATELAMFIYFCHPNGKDLIRLRVPEQMNTITTLMNMAIANEWLDAKYTGPEFVDASTAWLPDQLNITDPVRQFTSLIPQLAAPLVGVTFNKKFYPKVRPLENMSLENLPVSERYTEYTGWIYKVLGKKLNLSPVKLEFLVQGYLGRYTKFITGQKISNPFVREFYISGSRQLQKYYDLKKQNQFDYSAAMHRTKEFTNEERSKVMQLHGKISGVDSLLDRYRMVEKLDKANSELSDLRDRILDRIGTL